MIKKVPFGIQLIAGFYIFGGLLLLFTVFFSNLQVEWFDIAYRLGVPWLPEFYSRIGMALLSFIMVYGLDCYFKLFEMSVFGGRKPL